MAAGPPPRHPPAAASVVAATPSLEPTMQLPDADLDQLFRRARTHNAFLDRPVAEATLRMVYDLLKWGPTSANSSPARFVFLTTPEARERLRPALSPGNLDKTMS